MKSAGYIALCLAVHLLHASPLMAYPGYYAARTTNCTRIPTVISDLDGSPHSAPVTNNDVTFQLRDNSTNSLVTKVCPGGTYTVTLNLSGPGYHTIVTSTHGDFNESPTCGGVKGCPNRACKCGATRSTGTSNCPASTADAVTYTIKMPCDKSLAGTRNVFQAAFLRNTQMFGAMQVSTYGVDFGTDCAACGGGGGDDKPTLKLKAARSIRLNRSTKLEVEVQGINPPTDNTANNKVTLSWSPQDALACTPAQLLQLGTDNKATATCRGLKAGRVSVTVKYAGLTATQRINVRAATQG